MHASLSTSQTRGAEAEGSYIIGAETSGLGPGYSDTALLLYDLSTTRFSLDLLGTGDPEADSVVGSASRT